MNRMLTQLRLKELLNYDPESGIFTWRVNRRGMATAGSRAGYIQPSGYRYIKVDGKLYRASRLAWLFIEGYFPEHEIDHINRLRYDDRWKNLRHVTRQCNVRNCGNSRNNTSGIKGVGWFRQTEKWRVRIVVNKKSHSLGYYGDFNDAVCARLAAEQCLGWKGCDASSPAYRYVQRLLSTN